jgi:hypothetical protein
MSKESAPKESPVQPAKPEATELSETQLDQASGGLIYNDKPYYPVPPGKRP